MIDIVNVLPTGEENAIPSHELVKLCGYKNNRELQKHIELLRNQGHVICSSCRGGYYIHRNKLELRHYIHTQRSRAENTLKSVQGAEQELARLDGK